MASLTKFSENVTSTLETLSQRVEEIALGVSNMVKNGGLALHGEEQAPNGKGWEPQGMSYPVSRDRRDSDRRNQGPEREDPWGTGGRDEQIRFPDKFSDSPSNERKTPKGNNWEPQGTGYPGRRDRQNSDRNRDSNVCHEQENSRHPNDYRRSALSRSGCFFCGKKGHKKAECWAYRRQKEWSRGSRKGKIIKCFHCGIRGHRRADCWAYKRKVYPRTENLAGVTHQFEEKKEKVRHRSQVVIYLKGNLLDKQKQERNENTVYMTKRRKLVHPNNNIFSERVRTIERNKVKEKNCKREKREN